MVITGTVTRASQNILIAWNLPQLILKQFRNLELLDDLPQLPRKWFSNRTVFSLTKSDDLRLKTKLFVQLKPLQCLDLKAGRKCFSETALNKKDERFLRGSAALIYWHVAHVFIAAVERDIWETNSRTECKWRKQETQENREETHITYFTSICDLTEKEIIYGQRIMKLADLGDIYRCALKNTKRPNPGYKAEKVERKLTKSDNYLLSEIVSFFHWTLEESLNSTFCTVLTWSLIVFLLLHMNLAQPTWCKMLLGAWET